MALATLSIDLVAQLASLEQGLNKAGRLAERQAAQMESAFSGLKTAAAGIGGALAASLSAAGIVSFVRATVDGIDKLNDLSDATGASVENLSALEDIAARTGTEMETVGDAVIKLNKALGEAAKPGSDAANALAAIGLNAAELRKLDPAEALRQVAVALAGFANDGNKARVVQELFGKSIKQVAPLLNDLAKAGQLNATVTAQQAQEAERFNQQVAALQKNITDAARVLVGELLPALNKFLAGMRLLGTLKDVGAVNLAGEVFKGNTFTEATEAVQFYTQELKNLQTQREAAGKGSNEAFNQRAVRALDEQITKVKALQGFYQQLAVIQNGAGRPANEGGGGLRSRFLPDLPVAGLKEPAAPKDRQLKFELDKATEDALKAIQGTDTAKINEISQALDKLFELRASGVGFGSELDEAISKLRDELEKFNPAAREAAEAKRRLDAILAQTPTAILGEVLVDIGLLNKALDDGKISVQQWAEAVRNSTAKLPDAVKEPLEKIDEFTKQAASNIQDALGDSILATFSNNGARIEDIWKNTLKRLVAQAAAAQLGKALLGDDYGKTGQIGGGLGALLQFFSGFGGARASGGPVQAGRPYLVGERGPEIVVPRSSGTVLPNGTGLASGGATYVVNVTDATQENTVRLIQGALAQFEARLMSRRN